MRTQYLLFVLLLIWGSTHAAQAQRTLPVRVDLDYAAFAYGEEEALLETYLAFEARSLSFQKSEGGYRARLPAYLRLVPRQEPSSAPVWADSLQLSFSVPDTTSLQEGHHFIHQVRATVPPGSYELVVEIPSEEGSRREMMVRRQVQVPDFADEASLSDVVLASSIRQGGSRQNPFYKNGLTIRPNPRRLYGTARSQLFYYAEAYNAPELAGEDDQYAVHAYVSRANQSQPVSDLLTRQTKREARSPDVLVGSFDVGELPSGSYALHLALLNEQGEAVSEKARSFYVYSPGVEGVTSPRAAASSFETSPYASMPEGEVEKELEQIRLLATAQEERRLGRLSTLDEKRRFLRQFWQKRDPDPVTPLNEYRRDFKQRVHFTNQRYGNNFSEGWETDRGYVLLKYGLPVDIQPHRYEQGMMPYEIWRYENIPGEGQATFVFADRDGFGRFELLHSTVDGERHMPDWRQRITR